MDHLHFNIGDFAKLSEKALQDEYLMTKIDGTKVYMIARKERSNRRWFYTLLQKSTNGLWDETKFSLREDYLKPITQPEFSLREDYLKPSSAIQPDHYNADDDNDLIAMWSKIMKPNEFRRTMYSHISKYLYRYPDKKYEEDFNKAKEYIRRLEKWENETGQFGNEAIK